jgi:phosphatidylserine/phosphatidylglycerophosphate/cardiolipin synthase-like enzyme
VSNPSLGVAGVGVQLLPDDTYVDALTTAVLRAYRRVLCSIFIVDLSPGRDSSLKVDSMLIELSAAKWRGADVRLIVGGSRTNFDIAQLAISARARAQSLQIPCRALMASPVRGSHVKMVLADDKVFLGSHNWSPGAFSRQTQDSVALESSGMAAVMAGRFEMQWNRAKA